MPTFDPELHKEIAKATPPVAVTIWNYFFNMPLDKWVSIATLVYLVIQSFVLVRAELRKRGKK